MIEVGNVRRSLATAPDLDRFPERVEVAVPQRVADVRVVETAAPRRLVRQLGELIGRGVGAGG